MKQHKITFDTVGNIKVDATGYTGKACQETTEALLGSLGTRTKDEELKPEFNQREAAKGGIHQSGGTW